MRELEVRLALVCFGGASLAVYMNGISCEILKLVRASKVYHSLSAEQKKDTSLSYSKAAPDLPYVTDTESHYFDLLRLAGKQVDLRVIVDVISGTSAGGINGIFLARALAYDLDFDPLRKMWLEHGDIEELMEAETLAERGSKLFLRPVIWVFRNRIWKGQQPHPEARRKLSRFLRSRWFKPPFSGRKMLDWMIEANQNMGLANATKSLLPTNHQLDLFVSLTNFFGQTRAVQLHDPKSISERQHQVSLKFSHRNTSSGLTFSDFDDTNIPGLGFAARATSSFPGAFPPISLLDLKKHLDKHNIAWPHESAFYRSNFADWSETEKTIESMYFIDGGVTNNKPFDDAIGAIYDRPANREVNRRVIFVDPRPDDPTVRQEAEDKGPTERPSFFQTILSSLAEIPRDEPILGNLQAIEDKNQQTRQLESILRKVELEVAELLRTIISLNAGPITGDLLSKWRRETHLKAVEHAGFSYGGYIESKRTLLVQQIARLLDSIAPDAPANNSLGNESMLNTFSLSEDMLAHDTSTSAITPFFRDFDIDFRIRRLRFLLKRTNQQLQGIGGSMEQLKAIKAGIYMLIDMYKARWDRDFYEKTKPITNIDETMHKMAEKMGLSALDDQADQKIAELLSQLDSNEVSHALLRSYIGFAFFDIITLPLTRQQDLMEIDEILVDRISPLDCQHLHQDNQSPLMGDKLFNFGAFFSLRARENDYIWGRIHAANRLVDFIVDAAGINEATENAAIKSIRADLALAIANTEAKHTSKSADLINYFRQKFKPAPKGSSSA